MRKNYFIKLIKYIKNVYHIEEKINKLKDGRVNPSYKTGMVMLSVLFGFLLRIQSLNELNCMLKENEFKKLFTKGTQLPLVDTIRDTLKVIDLKGVSNTNKSIIRKAVNNKVFRNGSIDGYTIAAIDGTKLFGISKKCCEKCLTTYVKRNPHYYHSGAVMSLVGNAPNLVLNFEMYNPKVDSTSKDEGELNVTKRLL